MPMPPDLRRPVSREVAVTNMLAIMVRRGTVPVAHAATAERQAAPEGQATVKRREGRVACRS
jgi:hypothetical protein